jgi:hypothetical protein
MDDRFEKYVRENRSRFDDEVPSDELWSKIDQGLEEQGGSTSYVFWKVAAVILLLISVGLFIEREVRNHIPAENTRISEVEEVENYYTTLIAEKKQELLRMSDDSLAMQFLVELDYLDSSYQHLKSTFKQEVADERVVGAMIENLQLRIQILNRQLEILENVKQHQDEKVKNNNYET